MGLGPGDPVATQASLELDAFTSRLEELGVRQCADVTFLNDEDLKQAHDRPWLTADRPAVQGLMLKLNEIE
jgi:hypothetical protein